MEQINSGAGLDLAWVHGTHDTMFMRHASLAVTKTVLGSLIPGFVDVDSRPAHFTPAAIHASADEIPMCVKDPPYTLLTWEHQRRSYRILDLVGRGKSVAPIPHENFYALYGGLSCPVLIKFSLR